MAVRNTNVNYDDPKSVFKEIEIYIESLSSLKDKYNKEKSEKNKSELDSFKTNENPVQFASSRLLADKDFATQVIRTTTSGFKYLSNELKDNIYIAVHSLHNQPDNFEQISDRLKVDKDFIFLAMSKELDIFPYLSDEFKDNKNLALASLLISPDNFKHMGDKFKDDKDFALLAVEKNPSCFKHVSDKFKDDKDFSLSAVKINSSCFEHVSDRLKDDKKLALFAVKINPDNFKHISDRLKDNQEFILFAMEKHLGRIIMHASTRLRDDKDFALLAIDRKKDNYNYISERLQIEPEIILQFVKIATEHEDNFFDYMSDKVKNTYGHERSTFIAKVEEKKSLDETLKQFKNEEGSLVDRTIKDVLKKIGDFRENLWPKNNDNENKPGNK